jgi:hypothetical protein
LIKVSDIVPFVDKGLAKIKEYERKCSHMHSTQEDFNHY